MEIVGWRTTQTNKTKHWTGRLENEVDDVGLCLGFLAGDESAERGRRGRRERGGEDGERKSADVKLCNNQSFKKTGPCGHVYM